MSREPLADVAALFDVYESGVVWHCLCAVTRLGIPDRLAGGARAVPELAASAGVHAGALRRVLRLLAGREIVVLHDQDRVSLTDRGGLLCREHPLSLRATFATLGISDVAHALTDTVRTGSAAAPRVLGEDFWEYLARRPAEQEVFSEAMVEQARFLSAPCAALLAWPETGVVVDVAGGVGVLLAEVLDWAPGMSGILVDQPQLREHAEAYLKERGVADRSTVCPGDLFSPPPRAGTYLLSRILHDWDDEQAARILLAVAAGAEPGARLRVFEELVPGPGEPAPPRNWSDVAMMVLYPGARERTLDEYRALLERSGWRFDRVVAGPSGMSVVEATRTAGA